MAELKCLLITIKDWLQTGCWVRHEYIDTYQPEIIIYTDKGFRASKSLEHKKGEKVCRTGVLITSRCAVCGHTEHSWCTQAYFNNTIKTGRANI